MKVSKKTVLAAALSAAIMVPSVASLATAADPAVRLSAITGDGGGNNMVAWVVDQDAKIIKFQVGGADVAGRYITNSGRDYVRFIADLYDASGFSNSGPNINFCGANAATFSTPVLSDGGTVVNLDQVKVSGAGIGGSVIITFGGVNPAKNASRFEDAMDIFVVGNSDWPGLAASC